MRENTFFFKEPIYTSIRAYKSALKKSPEDAVKYLEKSHYYWLWYALTKNKHYIERCKSDTDLPVNDSLLDESPDNGTLNKLYEDFGDVRYDGSSHEAFMTWWDEPILLKNTDPIPNRPVKKTMTRGEYLFSEPLLDGWILQVENIEQAEKSLSLDSHALISIPLTTSKDHTLKRIKELLGRFHPAFIDQERKDPKKSKALYPPSRNLQIKKLKECFDVYDLREKLEVEGRNLSNADMADELKIAVQIAGTENYEDMSQEMEQYIRNGERISRQYGDAKAIIEAVGKGMFP